MEEIKLDRSNGILFFSQEGGMEMISDFPFKEINPVNYPDHMKAMWLCYHLADHTDLLQQLVTRVFSGKGILH